MRMLLRSGTVLLLGLLACKSVQKTYRQVSNGEFEGKQAPALEGGTWIAAGDTGESEFQAAQWRVVAFFNPD